VSLVLSAHAAGRFAGPPRTEGHGDTTTGDQKVRRNLCCLKTGEPEQRPGNGRPRAVIAIQPASSRASHALARLQSRITVCGETSSTCAVSERRTRPVRPTWTRPAVTTPRCATRSNRFSPRPVLCGGRARDLSLVGDDRGLRPQCAESRGKPARRCVHCRSRKRRRPGSRVRDDAVG
jgi:hypothetical protein